MAKTKQTKKRTKKEKPLQVMDGLNVSFEDAMRVLSNPNITESKYKKQGE